MIGKLGSKEAFYYQFGTQFSASDQCLVSRECLAKLRDTAVLWEPKTEELQELYNVHLQHHEFLYFRPDFDLILLKKVFF